MDTATCDLCGADLLCAETRYVAEIRVYAAYDPLEITREDLARDVRGELAALIRRLRATAADEGAAQALSDSVYKYFKFDLCAACHRKYIANPLSLPPVKVRETGRAEGEASPPADSPRAQDP